MWTFINTEVDGSGSDLNHCVPSSATQSCFGSASSGPKVNRLKKAKVAIVTIAIGNTSSGKLVSGNASVFAGFAGGTTTLSTLDRAGAHLRDGRLLLGPMGSGIAACPIARVDDGLAIHSSSNARQQ